MCTRFLFTTLSIVLLAAAACSDGTKEQSPGEVLARDSSLAADIKRADTSAFAEAADVATAFDPDSAMPAATSALRSAPGEPSPAVTMRVERSPTSTPELPRREPSPAAATTRANMRPTPAATHAAPPRTRILPREPARRDVAVGTRRSVTAASSSLSVPAATAILEKVPGASRAPSGSTEPCSSPAAADQRRCLMLHLARSDAGLDRTYQALIAVMKREAGTAPGAKEPETVHQLRVAQRSWLVLRDTECRRRNRGKEGPLWAPMRAECLGEFSGNREEELMQSLRNRRGR